MEREFERVKLLLTTTTAIQSESRFNPDDRHVEAFWNRFCSLATTPGRKMVSDSMWLSISHTHSDQICFYRAGMHGYSVGHSEMIILSSGLETFEVWTDHKPLVGIFQKSICNLDNPRLMWMREKIMEYTPEVKWVPGKTHYIADALSRSPMFDTNDDDYTISCNYQSVESIWESIKEGAKSTQYANLQSAVGKGESDPETTQFKTLMHRLSLRQIDDVLMVILDSTRIIIPDNSQKAVLKELHKALPGILKTYATAVQLYYWPGMKNCMKTFLSSCKICIKYSSQAHPPVTGTAPSAAKLPMNDLGVDPFDALGKKWLAVVCRFSGYAWLSHRKKKTTTASVLESLENLFLEYGYLSGRVPLPDGFQTESALPLLLKT